MMAGITLAPIGHVNREDVLEVHGLSDDVALRTPIAELKEAWQKPLRW